MRGMRFPRIAEERAEAVNERKRVHRALGWDPVRGRHYLEFDRGCMDFRLPNSKGPVPTDPPKLTRRLYRLKDGWFRKITVLDLK